MTNFPITVDAILHSPALADLNFSRARKTQFARDVALVVSGIRLAYLVDALPANVTMDYDRLLKSIPRADVRHVYEPIFQQSFLVNELLFKQMMSSSYLPMFVSTSPLSIVSASSTVQHLLDTLATAFGQCANRTVDLSSGSDESTMVALAGVLLEYPVAYVPCSTTPEACVSLTVYHIQAILQGLEGWVNIVSFSSPTKLSLTVDVEALRVRYQRRGALKVKVEQTVEVVDKLVL
ncbi:hypothetical protein CYLTODRAFT_25259 [Cylindrobasidium torrendii FP15055 ss-10]|uniref:Uncharacterized protein n=1 Tax=Cylindrobasidium torrendii FP15055 ss-10 TaxID=1314674 RepID=A0A0D7BB19_9AGAR|nr:hypothetical protein CYLTODRAFT_25259 [Cylindrobasidium torrendii FP15055 ss-10]